jgi:hypothetical protein
MDWMGPKMAQGDSCRRCQMCHVWAADQMKADCADPISPMHNRDGFNPAQLAPAQCWGKVPRANFPGRFKLRNQSAGIGVRG